MTFKMENMADYFNLTNKGAKKVQKFEHKKLQLTIQFRDTNPRYIVQQVSLISLFTGLAVTTSNVKKGMKFQLQASDLSANIE